LASENPFIERVLLARARTIQLSLDSSGVPKCGHSAEIPLKGPLDSPLWAIFVPPSLLDPVCEGLVGSAHKSANQTLDESCISRMHCSDPRPGKSIENPIFDVMKEDGDECLIWVRETDAHGDAKHLTRLLTRIHPSLSNFSLRGIITTRGQRKVRKRSAECDLILMAAKHGINESDVVAALESVQGESMDATPKAVIKALSVSQVLLTGKSLVSVITVASTGAGTSAKSQKIRDIDAFADGLSFIPSCPTCIHRLDPQRLGIPKPRSHQLCSHFCATEGEPRCSNMEFLTSWQFQSYCEACEVISKHWRSTTRAQLAASSTGTTVGASSSHSVVEQTRSSVREDHGNGDLCCTKCKMKETLWVCLTCGVVGCGRYSHGHAKEHYNETRHPYSLELVTQRIWDYATGEFAQRDDILNCPLMQRRLKKGNAADSTEADQQGNDASDPPSKGSVGLQNQYSFDSFDASSSCLHNAMPVASALSPDDPSPKKASMIGEEYEALLQSALEDQAQHYEFEITRLIAELTAKGVDEEKISEKETAEIEMLRSQISDLHMGVDRLSRDLLDKQAQEAGHRATYQRLLREQAIAKGLLEKIKEESERERVEGDAQVAELEQQVMDLTANLRMREQIARDEELSNAQIFGTSGFATASKPKRGKKSRRSRK